MNTTLYHTTSHPMRVSLSLFLCVCLFGHHHLDELLVVDLAIAIDISLADHLVHLLVGELLSEVGHDVSQLSSRDESIAVLVEHFESLQDLLLRVSVLHLSRHHCQELGEINGSVAIGIHLVDHVSELCLGGVLTKRSHHSAKLFGRDGSISVFVEQGESFLELSDLFFSQLISHCLFGWFLWFTCSNSFRIVTVFLETFEPTLKFPTVATFFGSSTELQNRSTKNRPNHDRSENYWHMMSPKCPLF
jgi:hypothetical protein